MAGREREGKGSRLLAPVCQETWRGRGSSRRCTPHTQKDCSLGPRQAQGETPSTGHWAGKGISRSQSITGKP